MGEKSVEWVESVRFRNSSECMLILFNNKFIKNIESRVDIIKKLFQINSYSARLENSFKEFDYPGIKVHVRYLFSQ